MTRLKKELLVGKLDDAKVLRRIIKTLQENLDVDVPLYCCVFTEKRDGVLYFACGERVERGERLPPKEEDYIEETEFIQKCKQCRRECLQLARERLKALYEMIFPHDLVKR